MPTLERKRVKVPVVAEEEPTPEWVPAAFRRRRRRVRALMIRHLERAPDRLTTEQLRDFACRYEKAEIEHALWQLEAQGVLHAESRREPISHNSSGETVRIYWRIAGGVA